MARLFPNDFGTAALGAGAAAELATLEVLRTALADDYSIYHGVHWADEDRRGTAVGEIDFAVVNQAGEILLVEQKAGTLEETDDGLAKDYGKGARTVADQVHRMVNHVQDKFFATHGERPWLDYLAYLPHHHVQNVNAAGIDASRIVHAGSDDTLAQRIVTVLNAWRCSPGACALSPAPAVARRSSPNGF